MKAVADHNRRCKLVFTIVPGALALSFCEEIFW
jgi:hypothetical protein